MKLQISYKCQQHQAAYYFLFGKYCNFWLTSASKALKNGAYTLFKKQINEHTFKTQPSARGRGDCQIIARLIVLIKK